MTLFVIFTLMTAAAIFAVLWPLSRRISTPDSGHDLAVYRDQLEEVERDRKAGLIGEAEAQTAKIEIQRRLLAAADAIDARAMAGAGEKGTQWRRRAAALVALVVLPLISVGLYLSWGSPHLPGAPLAARQIEVPAAQRSIESMVAQVEAHLERNPDDGQGWEVVAPVYMRMGRFQEAVRARANAVRLLGATAARESDLGEAQVAAGNGVVTAEAKASFERALKRDPNDIRATYFVGLAAEQDGRTADAARIWRDMLAKAPANAPYRPLIQQSLARVDPGSGADSQSAAIEPKAQQPGPSAEDVAASQQLTPEQRAEMVRGMVDRLAERLQTDTGDFEGWLRLVRAYVVMGEADKAKEAMLKARSAVGDDAGKRQRLDELAKGLGIEG